MLKMVSFDVVIIYVLLMVATCDHSLGSAAHTKYHRKLRRNWRTQIQVPCTEHTDSVFLRKKISKIAPFEAHAFEE